MSAIDQNVDGLGVRQVVEARQGRMRFYNDLIVGSIVYVSWHGDARAFIRCEVVDYPSAGPVEEVGLYKTLKPLGLVGKFDPDDLDRRDCYGEPMTGAAANLVRETFPFFPHIGFVYTEDQMPHLITEQANIELVIPPMTKEEKESADLWCRIKRAENSAKYAMSSDDPKAVIKKIMLDLLG